MSNLINGNHKVATGNTVEFYNAGKQLYKARYQLKANSTDKREIFNLYVSEAIANNPNLLVTAVDKIIVRNAKGHIVDNVKCLKNHLPALPEGTVSRGLASARQGCGFVFYAAKGE